MKNLRYQNYGNENISTKNLCYDCLINYIPNLQKKKNNRWVALKTKLLVFLQ